VGNSCWRYGVLPGQEFHEATLEALFHRPFEQPFAYRQIEEQ
jgi:hypothetical protein